MNSNGEKKRRSSELPPRRGLIKINIFKGMLRIMKSIPKGLARSRRENEILTSSSTTPAPASSAYNSEAESE